ncbi:hypothetical protein TcasGA2_TC034725 [Tribolium castaneum]|uniref:Uncharacterized protein n=1 Tax=Tribolium castaneum TaxID=7070 RepID=A0A139WGC7_TRICA|nr:hypothetical protein TcasGA2_TC034725 [Tribolium castaneum]
MRLDYCCLTENLRIRSWSGPSFGAFPFEREGAPMCFWVPSKGPPRAVLNTELKHHRTESG